ncbi:MAG TPA: molybdopterin biosynthesis protein [Candidatus Bathyarchaeia archaeon]|nr:molybdopterin biosynthesis protein [Candidatus Bathyarchaeia archaeon]
MSRKRHLNQQPLAAARAALLDAARALDGEERIPVEDALGRITAAPVDARTSVPHYNGAAMDGIAVRAEDTLGASEGQPVHLELGTPETARRPFSYVDTGNALPAWANAVVMIERVFAGRGTDAEGHVLPEPVPPSDKQATDPAGEPIVHLRAAARAWQHVRLVGEDVTASEPILPRGHRIQPHDIGALLAAGVGELSVKLRPLVAILPTGDELIEPGEILRPGRIVEFNSRMIAAFVREWGGEPLRLPPVGDDLEALRSRLGSAIAQADVVCVIAGSSAGEHDFTAEAIASVGTILAHGIDVMPGKPAIVAAIDHQRRANRATPRARVVLGIPGYPVSAVVICRELLEPLLARLLGTGMRDRPTVRAVVPRRLSSRLGQEEFIRVALGKVGDRLIVNPLARGAGVITTMVRADGFVRVPPPVERIDEGEEVEVELLRPLADVLGTIVLTGSHDLTLGILEDVLRASRPQYKLATSSVGSHAGLLALGRGEAHAAASHLLDAASGTYNLPDVERLLAGVPLVVVNLVVREQGLIVAPGNPLGLAAVDDLTRPGVRFVNHQSGAGTRALLDHLLEKRGIDPTLIGGDEREEFTHTAVAAAVKGGLADVAMGVKSAAAALGLDFVPIEREDYDLVLRGDFAESAAGRDLLAVIRSPAFREAVERLPGYDTSHTGEIKLVVTSSGS